MSNPKCPECHSTKSVKWGYRIIRVAGKAHRLQKRQCQSCGHVFAVKGK